MQKTKRRITRAIAVLAAATAIGTSTVMGAPSSQALTPNTVYFSTLAKCKAAKPLYSGSFTRITQDCTYAGRKLFGFKLDPGPYFLVFTERKS